MADNDDSLAFSDISLWAKGRPKHELSNWMLSLPRYLTSGDIEILLIGGKLMCSVIDTLGDCEYLGAKLSDLSSLNMAINSSFWQNILVLSS